MSHSKVSSNNLTNEGILLQNFSKFWGQTILFGVVNRADLTWNWDQNQLANPTLSLLTRIFMYNLWKKKWISSNEV